MINVDYIIFTNFKPLYTVLNSSPENFAKFENLNVFILEVILIDQELL